MPCYHPLTAWQLFDGSVVFCERGDVVRTLTLPCGQCIGCRLERSRQWAVRCVHEASSYERNCFITLTYDDIHLPDGGSLRYVDFQLFMKRLRKQYGPTRFYMCGEYGSDLNRPHYHACLFGLDFPDRQVFAKGESGFITDTSAELQRLWPLGHAYVGDFSFETAAYTARYVCQKVTGQSADMHYESMDGDGVITRRVSEFNKMSLKPGIGATWYMKFKTDVYPHDHVITRGVRTRPPKYYDRLYERASPLEFESLQYDRFLKFAPLQDDNSPERLDVKEQVTRAKIRNLKRSVF